MKLAVVTDTHQGAGNDRETFYEPMRKFYHDVLFPVIKENNIRTILHLGDIVERRRYINFYTLHRLIQDFVQPTKDLGLELIEVLGNHDVYYKNTNEINSPTLLFNQWPNIKIITEPTVINFDGTDIGLVPWVCEENKKRISKFLKTTQAQIIMGHFELKGFHMDKLRVSDHGTVENSLLNRFDIVASGHYHHKSTTGNVHYLGSPFQLNWGDFGDTRGFHIFDTETRTFDFVPNPYSMYYKYIYDDKDMTLDAMLKTIQPEEFKDRFIKVVVVNKTNPYIYDLVIDAIEKIGVPEIQVVEDHLNLDIVEDEEIIKNAEDTMTSMSNYVDALNFGVNKDDLINVLHHLYQEALMSS